MGLMFQKERKPVPRQRCKKIFLRYRLFQVHQDRGPVIDPHEGDRSDRNCFVLKNRKARFSREGERRIDPGEVLVVSRDRVAPVLRFYLPEEISKTHEVINLRIDQITR